MLDLKLSFGTIPAAGTWDRSLVQTATVLFGAYEK